MGNITWGGVQCCRYDKGIRWIQGQDMYHRYVDRECINVCSIVFQDI